MSTKIPCNNPAHGVKTHILGTAAANQCRQTPLNGARVGQFGVPPAASATPAASLAALDESTPWTELSWEDKQDRAILKTVAASEIISKRFATLGIHNDPHGGVGPYVSTGLADGEYEELRDPASGDIIDFTAAPDLEPGSNHGQWTMEVDQGGTNYLISDDLDIDSDPEKVADWVSDNLRDWRIRRGTLVASSLDDSRNWEDSGIVSEQFQENFRKGITASGLDCDAPDGSGTSYIYLSTGHTLATGMEKFESAQLLGTDGEEFDDLHFPEMKDVQTAEQAVRHWASFAVEAEKSLREGTYQKQE